MEQFRRNLVNYQPKNEQESVDKTLMLAFLDTNPDAFFRTNLAAHFTVSSFIVNHDFSKILFGYHRIYDSYGWLGGHADGDTNLAHVALKEAWEESGLTSLKLYSDEMMMIDVIFVPNHIKYGAYVSDHLHLNITYLLIADETEQPKVNPREHKDAKWFALNNVLNYVTEPRMVPVYKKAFALFASLKKGA